MYALVLTDYRRRLLLLGYRTGLQIWDCTTLDSIDELLNITTADWGTVSAAAILPSPDSTQADEFLYDRPLMGVMYVTILCSLSHYAKLLLVRVGHTASPNSLYIHCCVTMSSSDVLFMALYHSHQMQTL